MLKEKKSRRGTVIALVCTAALLALVIVLENTMKPTGMLFTVLKKGAVYAVVASSMNLLNGFTGLFSLGQAGFMLLGAYTYAILTIPTADREAVYYLYNGSVINFSLPELLAQSDVVSLHCPQTAENARMIDAGALAQMKDGAILLNTARGGLLDEQAVADALRSGKLLFSVACRDTIREFAQYRWEENAPEDRPRKENDHAMDEIRYFVSTVLSPAPRNPPAFHAAALPRQPAGT